MGTFDVAYSTDIRQNSWFSPDSLETNHNLMVIQLHSCDEVGHLCDQPHPDRSSTCIAHETRFAPDVGPMYKSRGQLFSANPISTNVLANISRMSNT
jgi:hypothetical protein